MPKHECDLQNVRKSRRMEDTIYRRTIDLIRTAVRNATVLNLQREIVCALTGGGITSSHKVFAGARMKAKHETQNRLAAIYLGRECARFAGG